MILNLLPILIGYTGGRMVHGQRGAVVAAVATVGVIVGTDIPMFLGAMLIGPAAAWVLKQIDKVVEPRIPTGVSYEEAAVVEPLACVLNAQKLINVGEGDTVLVMGAGPIGCLHVRLARALGASKVFLADVNGGRLALSANVVKPDRAIDMSSENLEEILKDVTDGRGPSVIMTAAPAGVAQEQAIHLVQPGGRISFFGGLPKDKPLISVDSNLVHYKELILAGANGSTPAQNREALELIASGKVVVADLITNRVSLDDIQDGIQAVLSGEAIKVVVLP